MGERSTPMNTGGVKPEAGMTISAKGVTPKGRMRETTNQAIMPAEILQCGENPVLCSKPDKPEQARTRDLATYLAIIVIGIPAVFFHIIWFNLIAPAEGENSYELATTRPLQAGRAAFPH